MPFHTITQPEFSLPVFIAASLQYLGTHPLALALLVTAAFLVICELGFAIARESARKRSQRRTLDRLAALTVAQGQQKATLGAVVAISSRREGGMSALAQTAAACRRAQALYLRDVAASGRIALDWHALAYQARIAYVDRAALELAQESKVIARITPSTPWGERLDSQER